MDFKLNEEQLALDETVAALFAKPYGNSEDRRRATASEPGFSRAVWQQLAELGALALPFPEELGGVDAGPMEVAIIAEQIGRVLAPEPYTEVVVRAGELVREAGTPEQKQELIGGIAGGELIAIVAAREPGRRWQAAAETLVAVEDGGQWRLTGVKDPVPHAGAADLLIASARTPAGTGLFLVAPDTAGVQIDAYRTHDSGRAATVRLDGVVAIPLGDAGRDAVELIERVEDRTRLAYAHEALGAMEFALTASCEYLKTRKQFGVTLNTFQALTHRAAEMYVALELARSTVLWASIVRQAEHEGDLDTDVSTAAAQAWVQVARASRLIGPEAIQLHGGIGMTAEYSVGHYSSRLIALEQLVGDASTHFGRLAPRLAASGTFEPAGEA